MLNLSPLKSTAIRVTISLALAVSLLSFSARRPVEAAQGDLDPSFGVGGKVTTDFFNNFDDAFDLAIQPDGKIIVVGTTFSVSATDFAIARYNSNGSLDPTFGAGGKVTTDFYGQRDTATSVALQSDGKIIVAGSAATAISSDFGLARYNSNGSLDTSFGTGGKVTTDFFGLNDSGNGVAIQSDGKIVVAGATRVDGLIPVRVDFALARYNSNGSLDPTFGSSGKVTTDFFGFSDDAEAIAFQPNGKFVVSGRAETSPRTGTEPEPGEFALARYNADGSLDFGFGNNGRVTTAIGRDSGIGDIALQPDGRIVAAGGTSSVDQPPNFALARYNNIGGLDPTFGSSGIVITDIRGFQDGASALKLQSDGKIVVAGASQDSSFSSDFALVRYTTTGSLDSSFGTGGKIITDFFGRSDVARALAIQQDGRIIAAGLVGSDTQFDFGLARYLGQTFNFDLCLQDDSNGNLLQLNSTTGEYLFTNCAGLTLVGQGSVVIRGSIITLQQNGPDRRVLARIDGSANKGTATIQVFSQGITFTIMDSNTRNNTCACS